jgi:hypothetical protein
MLKEIKAQKGKLQYLPDNGKPGESRRRKATGANGGATLHASQLPNDGRKLFLRAKKRVRLHDEGVARLDGRFLTTEQGFYFKIGNDFVGLYYSSEGPKLFFNRDKYRLAKAVWDVELVIGRKNNLFIFYWQGEVKISFRFSKNQDSVIQLYRLLQEHASTANNRFR